MMITRQVRCKKCGEMFPLTYPEKLSDIGRDVISYCPPCLHTEILKNERSTHNDHLCRAFEERYAGAFQTGNQNKSDNGEGE